MAEKLDVVIERSSEGLILNRDTIYESKRNSGILKIKKFNTLDLQIIDFEEGNGKIKNMIGAFITTIKAIN